MRMRHFIRAGLRIGMGLGLAGCATSSMRPAELPLTQRALYEEENAVKLKQEGVGRVVELRGEDGELARVSLGHDDGISPGKMVEFFVFADYSDLMDGGKQKPSPIAYGFVSETEPDLSWIKVTDPKREVVRRGHYVRIAPQQPKTPVEKVKGLFTKDKSESDPQPETKQEK